MLKTKFSNTTSIIACTLHEFQNTYVPLVKEKKPSKTSTYKKGFLPKNMLIVKSIFVRKKILLQVRWMLGCKYHNNQRMKEFGWIKIEAFFKKVKRNRAWIRRFR